MAYRLRYWLGAAIAGSALVALTYLPAEREIPEWWWFYPRRHEQRLEVVLRQYQARLHRLELRDSLVNSAREDLVDREPVVLVQEGLPGFLVDTLRALAEKPFAAVTNRAGEYRTVLSVSLYDGPADSRWYFSRLNFFMPVATDGKTCLVAIVLQQTASEADWLRTISAAAKNYAILGPCAYYAAFGRPGSHIEDWLESADFYPAMRPVWAVGAEPLRLLSREERRYVYRGDQGSLVACAAGNRYACRSLALTPTRLEVYYRLYPVYRREQGIVGAGARRQYSAPTGPNVGRQLSDLLVDMGDERFARFWTSAARVETAFAESFGVELEDWMMGWARIQWGEVERPVTEPASAMLGLLLVAVFVGGTTFLVRGRQVN